MAALNLCAAEAVVASPIGYVSAAFPPTIFLHGGGPGCTAWSDFAPVAPMFAHDRDCYLVDILQYGRSEKCVITGPMWRSSASINNTTSLTGR